MRSYSVFQGISSLKKLLPSQKPPLSGKVVDRHPKIPLRVVLVVPFVTQVVLAVGLTGYLSFRNGQQATNEVTQKFRQAVSQQIHQRLVDYFAAPVQLAQSNADAVAAGLWQIQDTSAIEQFLRQQLQRSRMLVATAYWDRQGQSIQATRLADGTVAVRSPATEAALAAPVAPASLLSRLQPPPIHPATASASWQRSPVAQPQWSQLALQDAETLKLTFIQPIVHPVEQLQGIITVDLSLAPLQQFLQTSEIRQSGLSFIVDQAGNLVASSTDSRLSRMRQGERVRLPANRSSNSQLTAAAEALTDRFSNLGQIRQPQQFEFQANQQRQLAQVQPFRDAYGLDWLIVVVVPEADFLAEARQHRNPTLVLCLLALAGAMSIGVVTSYWIAKPILRLSQASRALALGGWEEPVAENSPIAELEVLARSFNQMTEHLQRSLDQAKTALQESEEKFTTVFRASPDPISIATLDGTFLEVNDSFVRQFGYPPEEIVGRTALTLNLWTDMAERQRYLQALQQNGTARNLECTFRQRSGRFVTMLVSFEVIELSGQKCMIGMTKDITERRCMELALKRSEAKLNQILNTAFAAISCVRFYADRTYLYDYLSPAHEMIFGYAPDELSANPELWRSQVHPEDFDRVQSKIQTAILAGQSVSVEFRFCHKDGTWRWIANHLTSWRDAAANCWVVTAVATDITAQKNIEADLRQSASRFRGAFDTSAIGIAVVSLQGQFLEINSPLCEMLGYTESELLSFSFAEITHPEDDEKDWALIQARLSANASYYHPEKYYLHKDGYLIPGRLKLSWVRDAEQMPLYFIAQIQRLSSEGAA